MQTDTSKFYIDIEGQAARRKRERKQRYLLSLDSRCTHSCAEIEYRWWILWDFISDFYPIRNSQPNQVRLEAG
jgi:hypothetical protein